MSEQTSAGSSGADFDLSQFYQVFFEEAAENLANMETLLLELDVQAPDDEELNAIFRCAHSIKGGAATFGFQDVADLTHVMETLLDRLRRHELALTAGMVDVLLESGDALNGLLDRHRGVSDTVLDASDLVARIRAHADGQVAVETAPAASVAAAAAPAKSAPGTAPARTIVAKVTPAERVLDIVVGPLDEPALADQLAELFNEIPGLGRIAAADTGKPDAQNKRHFVVHTTSTDDDLLDLFTFHVSRELVAIRVAGGAPAEPVSSTGIEGFGLFADIEPGRPACGEGCRGGRAGGARGTCRPACRQAGTCR
jgi:two-component system chemotaxis sensor kinase CheA